MIKETAHILLKLTHNNAYDKKHNKLLHNIKRKSNSIHLLTEGEFSCNFLVYRPEKRKEKYLLE